MILWDHPSPTHPPLAILISLRIAITIIEPLFLSISKKHCCCKIKPTNSHWWKWLNLTANIDKVCHIHINPKNTAKSHNKNGSLDAKVPSYKFDEVKLENKINHFDKYRREMCAEAVTAIVNMLVERLTNAICQTLCPSEIWFANKLGNMVCFEFKKVQAFHSWPVVCFLILLSSWNTHFYWSTPIFWHTPIGVSGIALCIFWVLFIFRTGLVHSISYWV